MNHGTKKLHGLGHFMTANKICSNDNLFHKQLAHVKKVMSWKVILAISEIKLLNV